MQIVLALAVLLSHGWMTSLEFQLDDFEQIADAADPGSSAVLLGRDDSPRAAMRGHRTMVSFFRPMLHATFVIEVAIFGADPFALHAMSLFWHLLVVLMFRRVMRRLLLRSKLEPRLERIELWSFLAALLVAVHPGTWGAVSWIAARATSCRPCSSWSLSISSPSIVNGRGASCRRWSSWRSWPALLAKEGALVAPVLVAAIDWFILRRREAHLNPLRTWPIDLAMVLMAPAYLFFRRWLFGDQADFYAGHERILTWEILARMAADVAPTFGMLTGGSFHEAGGAPGAILRSILATMLLFVPIPWLLRRPLRRSLFVAMALRSLPHRRRGAAALLRGGIGLRRLATLLSPLPLRSSPARTALPRAEQRDPQLPAARHRLRGTRPPDLGHRRHGADPSPVRRRRDRRTRPQRPPRHRQRARRAGLFLWRDRRSDRGRSLPDLRHLSRHRLRRHPSSSRRSASARFRRRVANPHSAIACCSTRATAFRCASWSGSARPRAATPADWSRSPACCRRRAARSRASSSPLTATRSMSPLRSGRATSRPWRSISRARRRSPFAAELVLENEIEGPVVIAVNLAPKESGMAARYYVELAEREDWLFAQPMKRLTWRSVSGAKVRPLAIDFAAEMPAIELVEAKEVNLSEPDPGIRFQDPGDFRWFRIRVFLAGTTRTFTYPRQRFEKFDDGTLGIRLSSPGFNPGEDPLYLDELNAGGRNMLDAKGLIRLPLSYRVEALRGSIVPGSSPQAASKIGLTYIAR